MTSITFLPSSSKSRRRLTVGGDPPPEVLAGQHSLNWVFHIGDISGVPAAVAATRVPTGAKLGDIKGAVSIYVGTATAEGKAFYDEDVARWGYISHRQGSDDLSLSIHVSPSTFQHVADLAERGKLPGIEVDVTKSAGLRTSIVDGRLDTWDWDASPNLEIAWCEFVYELS